MSIVYTIKSFASSTAKYDDPGNRSNYGVFDTMSRLRKEKKFFASKYWGKSEEEFDRRQSIYEELLTSKHRAVNMTHHESIDDNRWFPVRETEIYLLSFADGFILVKEVIRECYADRVDKEIRYSITKEGWDISDPLDMVESIGYITKYGKCV